MEKLRKEDHKGYDNGALGTKVGLSVLVLLTAIAGTVFVNNSNKKK